jgi:dynein heavy chain
MSISLNIGEVPENWRELSYLSLKPLASWFEDLIVRINFFQSWIENTNQISYWMPGFYFPQAFLTSILQKYSRERRIPINTLVLKANFTKIYMNENGVEVPMPEEGVYIHGLFLENASWDLKKGVLSEAKPKILLEELPLIWLEPVLESSIKSDRKLYRCPVYKTQKEEANYQQQVIQRLRYSI